MRNSYKKYVFYSLFFSTFVFILYFSLIYIIDPAGINNKVNLGLIKDLGLASRTKKFNEINDLKPNTIMLGGSRVFFLNTSDVEKYTKDKVYNLAFNSSTIEEQYYFLKYSVEKLKIKNVIIGLNLYPFSEKLEKNPNTDFDKNIFDTGFTFQKEFKYYLEVPLISYFKDYYLKKYNEELYKNGSISLYNQTKFIDNRSWQEREKNSNRGYENTYKNYLFFGKTGFDYLKKMIDLCKENNVNYKVFITAVHESQLLLLEKYNKMDIYYNWKREIAKITPYWDFMYLNSITKDSNNYIDPSHILQQKGYLYFGKIFEDNSVVIPEDFGVYVTENNVEEHINTIKKDFLK